MKWSFEHKPGSSLIGTTTLIWLRFTFHTRCGVANWGGSVLPSSVKPRKTWPKASTCRFQRFSWWVSWCFFGEFSPRPPSVAQQAQPDNSWKRLEAIKNWHEASWSHNGEKDVKNIAMESKCTYLKSQPLDPIVLLWSSLVQSLWTCSSCRLQVAILSKAVETFEKTSMHSVLNCSPRAPPEASTFEAASKNTQRRFKQECFVLISWT